MALEYEGFHLPPDKAGKTEENRDSWQHRSRLMRCKSCMWFMPKAPEIVTELTTLGRCRRHAPTMTGYPVVFLTDWCGDHKLDEKKL